MLAPYVFMKDLYENCRYITALVICHPQNDEDESDQDLHSHARSLHTLYKRIILSNRCTSFW